MIVSSLLPYAGPLLKLLFKRGCCCCKRKSYQPNTHLNPEFPLVRKYASILNIIFISCTYGFCIPPIVLFGAIVIVLQFCIDKLLITFYFRENPLYNDFLNRVALKILKYAFPLYFFFAGIAVASNQFMF